MQEDRPGIGGRDAEQHPRQFRPPRANEAGEPEDLSGADGQGDAVNSAFPAAEILLREHFLPYRYLGRWVNLADFAAHHQADEAGLVDPRHAMGANALAVAQDGDAVRQRQDPGRAQA